MDTRNYDLAVGACSISADTAVHAAMDHYLASVATAQPGKADVEVSVRVDPAAVAATRQTWASVPPSEMRRSHPGHRYRAWATDKSATVLLPARTSDHTITVDGHHILVHAQRAEVAATVGVRIVRQLIMRGGENRGGRAVHAAAVDLDGTGILIGGYPGAGKSSVVTRLLETHHARPVSNDRTVLIPGEPGWRAVGVPLAWRFTPEGLHASHGLATSISRGTPQRGHRLIDGKIELTPHEVDEALACRAMATTMIGRLVILARLPDDAAGPPDIGFVRQRLDFGVSDFFAEDWLGIAAHLPGRQATASPVEQENWWAHLAATMPTRVLSWTHPCELDRVAAAVAGAASGHRS
ncbi:hypothetical protein [Alloactinosynnema sp. L-07]|uniref:hypothetical protein n=1 Tax=Alloactinosynnema sp. L-07 TaxID=1653480 RepID=UPI00065F0709|nr:hypothetical protein [Alloactinosynnema sp. L-07]CRK56908.1 hypothetical protein [Alloactinosynnema sp. L-07]